MTFYKCEICGKIIAMVKPTGVDTICCGQPMRELEAGTTDAAVEKHVPVCNVADNLAVVTVGSVAHPMLEAHYIEWIALETDLGCQVKALKAGDKPEASFALLPGEKVVAAYEYCNLHGLWKS